MRLPRFLRPKYSFSQDDMNEIYDRMANIVIAETNHYIELYESATKNNDTETAELSMDYITAGLHSLGKTRIALKSGVYPVTSDLVRKIEEQIKKLSIYSVPSMEA